MPPIATSGLKIISNEPYGNYYADNSSPISQTETESALSMIKRCEIASEDITDDDDDCLPLTEAHLLRIENLKSLLYKHSNVYTHLVDKYALKSTTDINNMIHNFVKAALESSDILKSLLFNDEIGKKICFNAVNEIVAESPSGNQVSLFIIFVISFQSF